MRFLTLLFVALTLLTLAPLFASAADLRPPAVNDGPPAAVLARAAPALSVSARQAPRPPQAPERSTCPCSGIGDCTCDGKCDCPSCALACGKRTSRRAERAAATVPAPESSPVIYDWPLAAYQASTGTGPVMTYRYQPMPQYAATVATYYGPGPAAGGGCAGGSCGVSRRGFRR